ncbi:MAG: cytochrome c3 family protein, partial [Planctomycetota bacterium]
MSDAALRIVLRIAVLLPLTLGCDRSQKHDAAPSQDVVAQRAPAFPSDAGYLGDAACAECHAEISEQYRGHSMGRSLATLPSTDGSSIRLDEAGSFTTGQFTAGGFRYEVRYQDDQLLHCQSRVDAEGNELALIEEEIRYAIGSGHHGRSYVVDRDGYLFMSPITWYPDKQVWDLSPGCEQANSQFNRPVVEACVFCHTNQSVRVPETANRYVEPLSAGESIGCERCHGPGRRHVELHRSGKFEPDVADDAIVNPARLEPELREAVCQQCHLSGAARVLKPGKSLYDFRPGDPRDSCFTTFVLRSDAPEDEQFVGQVEQMYQSRCFQASDGRMGCITCHDPHRLPTEDQRVAYYRDRCFQCHATESCGMPAPQRLAVEADDNCMACHMPRHETEVRHASVVNHRIPR